MPEEKEKTPKEEIHQIEGTIEHVLFRNEENGYAALTLALADELVTATGEFGDVEAGERLRLTGDYVTHPRYGMQFRAETCERMLPNTEESIRRYLSSGIIKGIGDVLARKIVDVFGVQTLDIMEKEPHRLMEVRGMSKKKCRQIASEAKHIFELRGVVAYFESYGIRSRYAIRAYRTWGSDCQDIIADNPYLLCDEEIGLDFRSAEGLAREFHIAMDSSSRVGAGILYLLRHNLNNGHTCLPLDRLSAAAMKFLEIGESTFYDAYQQQRQEGTIVEYTKSGSAREFVYLKEYYDAERFITDRIGVMRDFGIRDSSNFDDMIANAEKESGMTYAELQKEAIRSALSRGLLILTGGPGTGKTTTLNAIISCFEKQGNQVVIAAPTGRAAKRVADLTGYDARTIHRLLEVQFDPDGSQKFNHNEENPLKCDVLIVDEMSMVDVLLFSHLLRAIRLGCKMILVGDSDQLPSVGAGNLLQTLISSGCMPVVELKEIFRQAQQSLIVTNAHRIVHGEMPDIMQKNNDFFFFHRTEFDQAAVLLVDLVCRRLPAAPQYRFDPVKDIQVICPSRQGTLGVIEMNKSLQARLNPPAADKAQVRSMLYEFREGDKVMQTKNNYDITWSKDGENGEGIFNGDIGVIRSINRRRGEAVIDFEGRVTVYPTTMMEQLELAYAITVHKSQGSEFEAVVMPLLGKYEKLSYRKLLYTAVTRAKKLLIIIGTPQKIEQMVNNHQSSNRYSCLRDMLERSMKTETEHDPDDPESIFA